MNLTALPGSFDKHQADWLDTNHGVFGTQNQIMAAIK
jgi:hypothetical protein